jgi:DNA-binding response OmpR family regulator
LGTLLDRLDAHAAQPENAANYVLGPYEFIVSERLLRRRAGDSVVRLTELERRLLACLAEADGAIVARDQLLARVWGYSPGVATHTVETHIWRLRQKMESDDSATGLLQTEGGGYRLASIGMDSGV